jgi:hypothetical protein
VGTLNEKILQENHDNSKSPRNNKAKKIGVTEGANPNKTFHGANGAKSSE